MHGETLKFNNLYLARPVPLYLFKNKSKIRIHP